MGKFDNRRTNRKTRHSDFKQPRANSFLIVSEGKETEPRYFEAFGNLIKEKIGGSVDAVNIPLLKVEGKGRSTKQLLYEVDKIVNKSKVIYQNIWVLFDKDEFDDFDEAIKLGEEKGYNVAWSNYCFEYWLLLHDCYSDSALDSKALEERLSNIYKRNKIAKKYTKNDPKVFDNIGGVEGVKTAINNAKRRMNDFDDSILPSEFNPGTKVYKLAEKLVLFIEEQDA